ncbi:MAG: hypothetical protein WAW17_15845, partial [Rhodococcus sp. (in: high G+C Gram-positive bacteria)]|uniref:hypothetical protein n=1 Tax=Rhodococcus sp. TaxID=1831 RepID=UPI003BAE56A1
GFGFGTGDPGAPTGRGRHDEGPKFVSGSFGLYGAGPLRGGCGCMGCGGCAGRAARIGFSRSAHAFAEFM